MKNEINPTVMWGILGAVALALIIGIYLAFFKKEPAPDITKIKPSPPPGWRMPTGPQGPATPPNSSTQK